MYHDKNLKSIADAVSKVMEGSMKEELKGNQHKIDANKNNKIDAHDFKLLRAGKKVAKEEVEQVEEAAADKAAEILAKKREERMEKMDYSKEKTATSNVRKVEGKYGKEEMNDNDEDEAPKKATKKGVFKRRYNTKVYKEQFSELLDSYVNGGLKGIMENLEVVEVEEQEMISEEVDNETFTKEVEAQKAKAEGKGKKADVAAASVQAVKNEEVEQIDELSTNTLKRYKAAAARDYGKTDDAADDRGIYTDADHKRLQKRRQGWQTANNKLVKKGADKDMKEDVDQVEERTLTSSEMETREKNVKGMKKNLAGFKERYGKRAKEVLYATATRMAKKEQ